MVKSSVLRSGSNASNMLCTAGEGASDQFVTGVAGKRKSAISASLPFESEPRLRDPSLPVTILYGLPHGSLSTFAHSSDQHLFLESRMAARSLFLAVV